jgi:hypothetical protein
MMPSPQKARVAGKRAHAQGLTGDANPYLREHELWLAWLAGWWTADLLFRNRSLLAASMTPADNEEVEQ